MKKLLFAVILLCTALPGISQESSQTRHELALDMTPLLARVFAGYAEPYSIAYRFYLNEKTALRGNLRLNYSNGDISATSSGIPMEIEMISQSFLGKLGIERYVSLTEKWNLYFGLDFLYATSNNKSKRTESGILARESKTERTELGAAPLAGVEFKISDRISLRTETFFSVVNVNSFSEEKYYPSGFSDYSEESGSIYAYLTAPTSLFLSIKF